MERDAFREIYQQHGRAVHAVACRVAWPGVAEDVTQEVFLRLWRDPERYDPSRGSLRSFLLTVTHNVAIDTIRSDIARRAREQRHAEPETSGPENDLDSRLLRDDRRAVVTRALATLRPDDRAAVVTAYYGGCTYQETACALGVAEGTAKSRIRRGLQHLQAALTEFTPLGQAASSIDA